MDGVMTDAVNCLKVAPQSAKELTDALKTLIDDEKLRTSIGKNGYENMEQFFRRISGNSHAKQVLSQMKNKGNV